MHGLGRDTTPADYFRMHVIGSCRDEGEFVGAWSQPRP
jgi:hypothetical protein